MKFSSKIIIAMLLLLGIMQSTMVKAQKFEDLKKVGYIQLPGVSADYTTASVFLQEEQNSAEEKLTGLMGSLAKKAKKEEVVQTIEDFAKKAIGGQKEKYADWTLLPADFANTGSNHLKVVITYAPDVGFRPMGKPMKNNDNEFQFEFYTTAKMMLYNGNNELLMEEDFGYLTGTATSETWPDNGGGSKAFGISIGDKKDKKKGGGDGSVHPYTEACAQGALEHAKRIVYGMYGVHKFEKLPMHITWKGKPEKLKGMAKDYAKLIENKKSLVLNTAEMAQMQRMVDEWENVLSGAKDKNAWMFHYNLAAGYAWLQKPEKSKEHIAKVYEEKQKLFDKIANKSGNWKTDDIDILVAYNTLQPFAEYYAAGLANFPDYEWDKGELFVPAFLAARNVMASQALGLPIPVPLFPVESKSNIKQAVIKVKYKGKKIGETSYDFDNGKLSIMRIRGEGDNENISANFELPDNSYNSPNQKNYYYDFIDMKNEYRMNARFSEKGYNYDGKLKTSHMFPLFITDGVNGNYGFQNGMMDIVVNDQGFFEEFEIRTNNDFGLNAVIKNKKEKYRLEVSPDLYIESYKILEADAIGYPIKVEHNYTLENLNLYVWADIKTKFGESTFKEQSRQSAANREAKPKAEKLLLETAKANGASIEDGELEGDYTFRFTEVFDVSIESNKKGLWNRITFGDYEIKRDIN